MSTTVAHLDPSKIIDGKLIATKQLVEIKNTLIKENKPGLAVILVGNDPASHTYVKIKYKPVNKSELNHLASN